jgi:hypothetical protein
LLKTFVLVALSNLIDDSVGCLRHDNAPEKKGIERIQNKMNKKTSETWFRAAGA